jgi:hypothetical protein
MRRIQLGSARGRNSNAANLSAVCHYHLGPPHVTLSDAASGVEGRGG